MGIDFESGVVDWEVESRDMTPEAIKVMSPAEASGQQSKGVAGGSCMH